MLELTKFKLYSLLVILLIGAGTFRFSPPNLYHLLNCYHWQEKEKKLTCGSFLFLDLFSIMRFYKIILLMASNTITVWGNQYLLGRTMMIFQISMTALFILVLFGYWLSWIVKITKNKYTMQESFILVKYEIRYRLRVIQKVWQRLNILKYHIYFSEYLLYNNDQRIARIYQ